MEPGLRLGLASARASSGAQVHLAVRASSALELRTEKRQVADAVARAPASSRRTLADRVEPGARDTLAEPVHSGCLIHEPALLGVDICQGVSQDAHGTGIRTRRLDLDRNTGVAAVEQQVDL